jgi:hypothetical protein
LTNIRYGSNVRFQENWKGTLTGGSWPVAEIANVGFRSAARPTWRRMVARDRRADAHTCQSVSQHTSPDDGWDDG